MEALQYNSLSTSPVRFDEARHRYEYFDPERREALRLVGITTLLGETLFRDKYTGVPQHILERAASRGSEVHALCQMYNIFGEVPSDELERYPETRHYIKLIKDKGLEIIANEYLVSDLRHYATMIDCIDSEGNLYDIKTTRELDTDYLSWQLSLGAWLFELQNPQLKAGRLYGIHLRPEGAKMVQVKRKSAKELIELMQAHQERTNYTPQIVTNEASTLSELVDIEGKIVAFQNEIKALNEVKERAMARLTEQMIERGTKKIETERLKVTLIEAGTRQRLDTKALQAQHPELCQQFIQTTDTKPYVRISIKQASV